jgi:NADH dehydrogenase (ubiquinone) flavoprotein 2
MNLNANYMLLCSSTLSQSQLRMYSAFVNHRNTPDNLEETPFEFTNENYEKIREIMGRYPTNYKHSAVIPLLMIAQKQNENFLTLSAMNKVAKVLEMVPMQVYEVASFYTMFNRTKLGKYHLQVCGTTPCMLRGAREIIDTIKQHCHIEMDETSEDGLFTVSEVECLGACVNAPMLQINNEWFYEVKYIHQL